MEISEQIELFRSGAVEERQQAIANLLKQNPLPLQTIRRLLAKEENEALREQMSASMYQSMRETISGLLARGERAAVEEMFDEMILASPAAVAQDYAAFMYLHALLDALRRVFSEQARSIKMALGSNCGNDQNFFELLSDRA